MSLINMRPLIFLIMVMLFLLSGCKIQYLSKVITFEEGNSKEKPCVMGVWPAVQSGNRKYKMTQNRANRFIIDVQTATGHYRNYKRIKASKNVPANCKKLLWHSENAYPNSSYLKCMVAWGENTLTGSCSKKRRFVVGAAVSSSGRARILIVDLAKPKNFANKRNRSTSGKDLNRLARNIGRAIRKEIK